MAGDDRIVSELYRSFPLAINSKHIRLLHVHADNISQPIKADLQVVDLDQQPSFSALSYVWGHDVEPHAIHCGAFLVKVTCNCYAALRSLRKKYRSFTIWIDAVCINQEDQSEKAQQIPLMGQIYSGAEAVYAWLGDSNTRSKKAMAYLARAGFLEFFLSEADLLGASSPRSWAAVWSLFASAMDLGSHALPTDSPDLLLQLMDRLRGGENKAASFTTYHELEDLLDREWIKRMWTYQEILLASNPIIVCGDDYLEWSRLSWSIVFLGCLAINDQEGTTKISNLITWTKVTYSRGRLTALSSSPPNKCFPSQIKHSQLVEFQSYHTFVNSVFRKYRLLRTSGDVILLLSVAIDAIILTTVMLKWESSETAMKLCLGFLPTFVTLMIVLLQGFIRWRLSASPNLESPFPQEVPREDLVDAITSRKARDPRDKAFAVQAVLRKLSPNEQNIPDYRSSLGQIYKCLCVQLMQTTGSLHLLLVAALNHCSGQPSWVPDWSQEFPALWRDRLDIRDSDGNIVTDLQAFRKWNPTKPDRLIIRGRQLGTISACFRFWNILPEYHESESSVHFENLQNMLAIFDSDRGPAWKSFLNFVVSESHCNTDDFVRPHRNQLRIWENFLSASRKKSPSEVLSTLTCDNWQTYARRCLLGSSAFIHHYNAPFKDILETHILVCNILASARYAFFEYEEESQGGGLRPSSTIWLPLPVHRGVCTNDVQVGDRVMFISGLPSLVIARGKRRALRLTSPVIMRRIYGGDSPILQKHEEKQYALV